MQLTKSVIIGIIVEDFDQGKYEVINESQLIFMIFETEQRMNENFAVFFFHGPR